ncbi:MAG TPA: response regulator [Mycobacteriales bacterium]|jgi:CheY-like chemotaxis protein|nr:response regulator [Mycobacteriales bacterium]
MARILQVDDEPGWRDAVRQALAEYHVDLASSYDEALTRLRTGPAYDLALVDLDLAAGPDPRGDDLLHLLRTAYPDTRRIVVADAPPGGATVLEKYGVEELLLRPDIAVPDVRHAVDDALGQQVSAGARIRRAELWRRYQDWRRRQDRELDGRIQAAETFARNAGRVQGDSRRRALAEIVALRERFRADANALGDRIEAAATVEDTLDAADILDHLEDRYTQLI